MLYNKPKLTQKIASTPKRPSLGTYLQNFASQYRSSLSIPPVKAVNTKPLPRLVIPKTHIDYLREIRNELIRNADTIIDDYYKGSGLEENRIRALRNFATPFADSELLNILFNFYKTAFQKEGINLDDRLIFGYARSVLREIKPRNEPLSLEQNFFVLDLLRKQYNIEPRKVPEDFIIRKLPTGTTSEPLFEVLNPQQIIIESQEELKDFYINTLSLAARNITNVKQRNLYVETQMMRWIMNTYSDKLLGSSPEIQNMSDVYTFASIAFRNIFGRGFDAENPYFKRSLLRDGIDIGKLLEREKSKPVATPLEYSITEIYSSPKRTSIEGKDYSDSGSISSRSSRALHTYTPSDSKLETTNAYSNDESGAVLAGFGLGGIIPLLLGSLQDSNSEKKTNNIINTVISLYQLSQKMPKNQQYIPTTSISSTPFILYDRWQ